MADETEAQEDTKKGGNPRGKTPAARGDETEAQEDTKKGGNPRGKTPAARGDETEAQEDTKKGGNPRGKTPAARGDGTEAQEDTKRDPLQLAVQLADRVAIKNVMLSRCEVNRSPNLDPTAAPLTVQNSVSEIRFGKDVESNVLFALPTFTLESIQRDENTNEPKLSIKASFVLFYSLDSFEGIEDEQLGAFSATNGVFNAWPYWREFVQNMAARMGLATPIVIPVFRLGQTQSTEQIGAPESLEK